MNQKRAKCLATVSDTASAIIQPRIAAVIEHVVAEISHPERMALRRAARMASVSPEHFSRIFRRQMGISFAKWQARVRMQVAKELLLCEWKEIQSIGVAVGYEEPSTFGRVFKRFYGISPRALRKVARSRPDLIPALAESSSPLVVMQVAAIQEYRRELLLALHVLATRMAQSRA